MAAEIAAASNPAVEISFFTFSVNISVAVVSSSG